MNPSWKSDATAEPPPHDDKSYCTLWKKKLSHGFRNPCFSRLSCLQLQSNFWFCDNNPRDLPPRGSRTDIQYVLPCSFAVRLRYVCVTPCGHCSSPAAEPRAYVAPPATRERRAVRAVLGCNAVSKSRVITRLRPVVIARNSTGCKHRTFSRNSLIVWERTTLTGDLSRGARAFCFCVWCD